MDEAKTAQPTDLLERLRNTPNWLRESYGHWKDCTSQYDRAPFEAADEIQRLRAATSDLREALRPFANYACSPAGECACHNCKARDAIARATA